jgi:alpha-mannosidase
MKYFKMYYTSLNKEEQIQIKKLIQSGQLEIVTGGWVINDEACPNYEDIISLMQMGHTFVKREFGVIPRVGWMLDAFGHSAANAALFSDFGFDSIIFSRISDTVKGEWEQNQGKTFLWRPMSKNLGRSKEILAVYHDDYDFPEGFKTDDTKWFADKDIDAPIQDDPSLLDYNADKMAVSLIN